MGDCGAFGYIKEEVPPYNFVRRQAWFDPVANYHIKGKMYAAVRIPPVQILLKP